MRRRSSGSCSMAARPATMSPASTATTTASPAARCPEPPARTLRKRQAGGRRADVRSRRGRARSPGTGSRGAAGEYAASAEEGADLPPLLADPRRGKGSLSWSTPSAGTTRAAGSPSAISPQPTSNASTPNSQPIASRPLASSSLPTTWSRPMTRWPSPLGRLRPPSTRSKERSAPGLSARGHGAGLLIETSTTKARRVVRTERGAVHPGPSHRRVVGQLAGAPTAPRVRGMGWRLIPGRRASSVCHVASASRWLRTAGHPRAVAVA